MDTQTLKNSIRQWIKSHSKIDSNLGEIGIGKLLGEGGSALVFEAKFSGEAAVKFLAESISATRFSRFLSEYRNLVKLVPTGSIVPLYHFGVQDVNGERIPYIVMERCVETLHDQYKDEKLLNSVEFRSLLERLLKILETLHNSRIVHRDIKPKNILLRPNGEWVLGDFGIAWFDPETYDKLAKTKRGDRLANWGFSAPEQSRRDAYDKATPCLDLYALGQTLYHCVSGQCIAGPGYPTFSEIAPSLSDHDPLIEWLVRHKPLDRPQSIGEIRQFLERQEKSEWDTEYKRDARRLEQTQKFNLDLRRSMPGRSYYAQAKDKSEIDRVLTAIAENCAEYDLKWTAGRRHDLAYPIKQLSEEIWLIGEYECAVVDLWVNRPSSHSERHYVLIHLAPRPPFGLYDSKSLDWVLSTKKQVAVEEAGYFNDRYVTVAELDDGFTEIDGEIVELVNPERRFRNLEDDFFILAPRSSIYFPKQNIRQIDEVCLSLREAGQVTQSLLEPLERLERRVMNVATVEDVKVDWF